MRHRFLPIAGIALAALMLIPAPTQAQEPQLIADQADGVLELQDEAILAVEGLSGSISIRPGKPGELRFSARALNNRRDERPVALWLDGRRLRFQPSAGHEDEPLILQVTISPELAGEIFLDQTRVSAGGFGGGLTLRGTSLEAEVYSIGGPLQVEQQGGSLSIQTVEDEVSIDGREIKATLKDVKGFVSLSLAASEVELAQIEGQVDADLEQSNLTAQFVRQGMRASARGGSLILNDVRKHSEFRLDETTLALEECKGEIEVETNAEVRFRDLEAGMRVTSFGGSIRGVGASAPLELHTNAAEITIEGLRANTDISGDRLTVRVKGNQGDLRVRTTASNLFLEDMQGAVDVENDFGDVTVTKAAKPLKIVSRDGDVRVSELSSSVDLRSDGNQVRVSWSALSAEGDSFIQNESGDVWVDFPAKSGGRLDAEAPYGRIESTVPSVRVTDDGNFASGTLGRANRPTIQIKSGGNLFIGTGSAP